MTGLKYFCVAVLLFPSLAGMQRSPVPAVPAPSARIEDYAASGLAVAIDCRSVAPGDPSAIPNLYCADLPRLTGVARPEPANTEAGVCATGIVRLACRNMMTEAVRDGDLEKGSGDKTGSPH